MFYSVYRRCCARERGLNRPRADFAPGEPPKGQEEEGTPEDKQGGSVVQGAAVGIRKRGGAECDVREREEQRGHHAGDAGKRQDHDPEQARPVRASSPRSEKIPTPPHHRE